MIATEEVIKEILSENIELELDVSAIEAEQDLTDLGLDSVYFIQLMVAFENVFGLTFEEEDLDIENFITINKTINYLNKKLDEQ